MSFGTDIRTIMTGDASLNSAVDGIYFEHLPDNFDLKDSWVVYSFRRNSQQDCLDHKNAFHTYEFQLRVVCPDTSERESLTTYIINMLNGVEQGGIKDMWFIDNTPTTDLEKGIYANTLSFESFYVD